MNKKLNVLVSWLINLSIVAVFVFNFMFSFYLNKVTDDSCYSSDDCDGYVMVNENRNNAFESFIETVLTPLTLPVNIYTYFDYKSRQK